MDFTSEEISLCKQVAEKYRKKIEYGNWVYKIPSQLGIKKLGLEPCPCLLDGLRLYSKSGSRLFACDDEMPIERWFPLWTISDCLEFFEEREHTFERSYQLGGIFNVRFISSEGTKRGSGDTFLIACLKAVLAVLEDSNG